MGAPIFTTRAIMEETGFVMEVEGREDQAQNEDDGSDDSIQAMRVPDLERYSIEELEKTLARLIEREEYEEAARVSEILKRKKSSNE